MCTRWYIDRQLRCISSSKLLVGGQPSIASSYNIHQSMIAPSVSDIVRMLSNKTQESSSKITKPPTNLEKFNVWKQELYNEVRILLQSLPVLIPRIITFFATLHIVSEYGFQTINCEGPSMEPTIIDGSNTCVLIERWSHRLFGLENRKKHADADDNEEKKTNSTNGNEQQIEAYDENSWSTLFYGIWKQHFASGLDNGDVIILHHPGKEATICKRIIGMPGDTIIRSGGGDEELNHTRIVPPGHLWIEGDNTLNSLDSRSYGMVPASLVIGKVMCRLWPLRDYVFLGKDANGVDHWMRVRARIGRLGGRPALFDRDGSHLLATAS